MDRSIENSRKLTLAIRSLPIQTRSAIFHSLWSGLLRYPKNPTAEQLNVFWHFQYNWSLKIRIETYQRRLNHFLSMFVDADEGDFICEELKTSKEIEEHCVSTTSAESQVGIWLRKYIKFLLVKQHELDTLTEVLVTIKDRLPFSMNKTETIAFFILLYDKGIIKCATDYELAKHIEKHAFYDTNKPLSHIMQEISKYRNSERPIDSFAAKLKEKLGDCLIRTKDDLKSDAT